MSAISQRLSGSDLDAYLRFASAEERYRHGMEVMLSTSVAEDTHYRTNKPFPGTDIVLSLGSAELWKSLPLWEAAPEPLRAGLSRSLPLFAGQLCWVLLLALLNWRIAGRLKAV